MLETILRTPDEQFTSPELVQVVVDFIVRNP
jgi:hypothetical protein